jgi:polysaccharide pyruvyl transferase CsaB
MRKKVLLAGYYGFDNTGDEAILSAMLSQLRSHRPDLEVTVVSGNPQQTAARYNVSALLYTDLTALFEAARQCQLIILGGGGLFHDYWGFEPQTLLTRDHWSISFYNTFPLLATLLDKPLMLFAIGVGPLLSDAGRQHTHLAFEQASVATVRDQESKDLMLSLGVPETRITVTADPAYLTTPSPKERAIELLASEGCLPSDQWLLGVALRKWDIGVEQEKWTREVGSALDIVIERYNARVVFVPFQQVDWRLTDDQAVSTFICEQMRNRDQTLVLRHPYSAAEKAGILGQCDLVLGMRLHSIIFAANAGVPVIALSYDPKVRHAMRQLGCEKYAIDLPALSAVQLLKLFEEAYKDRSKISRQLDGATHSLRGLAKTNTELALEILDHPQRYRRELSSEALDFLKQVTLNLALGREKVSQRLESLEAWAQKYQSSSEGLAPGQGGADKGEGSPSPGLAQAREAAQLQAVIDRVRNSKGAIIFLPAVSWKIHLFQRPHHLAREFAQLGYISIFHTTYPQDGVDGFEEIERNLFLFYGLDELLYKIPEPILWAFTYNFQRRVGYPPSAKVVYDLVDDPDLFPLDPELLEKNHSQALQEAMIVTGVSKRLCKQTSAARPDTLYLANGVDYFHFASHRSPMPDDPEISEILEEGKPIAGYYGALAEWFDYDLLRSVAELRPDWNFILIGAMYDQSMTESGKELLNRSNVFWIGSRDYASLPDYLQFFDVATIPFVINNITLSCSPIKLYEYLAGGKPVISTPIPECQEIPEVHIVRDAEEFSQALDLAREQGLSQEFRRRLRNLARKNSWSARAQLVSEHIEICRQRDSLPRRLADIDGAIGSIRQSSVENEQIAKELSVELAEKNQIITTLSARMIKQEQSLLTQIAEKDQGIQSLASELAEKREEIAVLSSQAAQAEQNARSLVAKHVEVETLSSQVAQAQDNLRLLSAELVKEKEERKALSSQAEQNAQSLASQLATKERSVNVLLEQLSVKDNELSRITNTPGWRLLSRYGQIKYRYLLPIYKALGLPPYDKKGARLARTEPQPLEPSPGLAQSADVSSKPDGLAVTQSLPKEPAWPWLTESNAYDVVCLPIIDWNFRFQRPQQLMSRFAAAGHRVFYICQKFYSDGPPYKIREIQKNIFEVWLRGPAMVIYTDVMEDRARDIFFDSLDALRRDVLLGATVAVTQLPFWWPLANKTRSMYAWPIVYDCMDYHAGFSTKEENMIGQEHDLLTSADLVVVSSDFLQEQARQFNSNVLMVRNGCEYEHFASAGRADNQRPVIGYYGAIADWFDADLVADLARKRPDWDFVLVGSTFGADLRRLSKLGNVSLPGEKPYDEIPDWLSRFDVAIIPFQRTPLTEATNPVKAYEILASGKPIVSVPIPEVAVLAPLVRLASTAEEFEQEIIAALNENDPQLIENRRAFAGEHTWEKRYETLSPAIRKVFPKASIIIVTYNNIRLNRLCLESLYGRTEWPNFEVIVIDNASADGTPQYLMEAKATLPNLSVILNDENLGFAAGNNLGLKQAGGEYLVLLNNDTVLTRGWLSALIRHLHADPGIGIIGPVTNEIGNEAKVEVGYQQLEEMPAWAANFVRANDSRLFAINVLAMFCVAMRSEVFAQIGTLDESFQIGMFEDDDYTRRVRDAGYKIICASDSFIHHAGGASFKLLSDTKYLNIFLRNRRIYEEKWGLWEPHVDRQALEWIPDLCNRLSKIVKKSAADAGRIVIFLPSVGWNNPVIGRPHHLATELARQGFLVFFDCSGSRVDHFAGFEQVKKNLWTFNGPKGVLDTLEHAILWTLPYTVRLTERWENPTIIYDWIDDLSVLPYKQSWLQENHERMLKSADLILCVAQNLRDQVRGKRPDALYVQNGVEYERFSSPASSTDLDTRFKEMVDEGRPIAGYYGAIASWFDVDMLAEVAQLRSDWNFVIIGHRLADAPSLKALEERPNVLILQEQKYESLPNYLAQFAVAIIPFKVNQITEATVPVNLYEYFAGGKPVISTPLTECQRYEEVRIVRDAQEFSSALDAARESGRNPKAQERLLSLGRENSWARRVQTVMEALSKRAKSDLAKPLQLSLKASEVTSNGSPELGLE